MADLQFSQKLTEISVLNAQLKVLLIGLFRVKYEIDCYSELNILYLLESCALKQLGTA